MTTIDKVAMECSIQINNEISDFITETVNETLGKKKTTINAKKIAEAIQKQTPKKPDDVLIFNDTLCKNYKIGFCGSCKAVVDNTGNYCRKCGQAILWEEQECK